MYISIYWRWYEKVLSPMPFPKSNQPDPTSFICQNTFHQTSFHKVSKNYNAIWKGKNFSALELNLFFFFSATYFTSKVLRKFHLAKWHIHSRKKKPNKDDIWENLLRRRNITVERISTKTNLEMVQAEKKKQNHLP